MKKKNQYIFISNGYRGGAATFLSQHIEFLLKNKKKVTLIDDSPFNTFENLNSKINIYKVNVNSLSTIYLATEPMAPPNATAVRIEIDIIIL